MSIQVTGYWRTRNGKKEFVKAYDKNGNPAQKVNPTRGLYGRMNDFNASMDEFTKFINPLSDEDLFKILKDDYESGISKDGNDEYGQALNYIEKKYPEWRRSGKGKLSKQDSDFLKEAISDSIARNFIGSEKKDGEDPKDSARRMASYHNMLSKAGGSKNMSGNKSPNTNNMIDTIKKMLKFGKSTTEQTPPNKPQKPKSSYEVEVEKYEHLSQSATPFMKDNVYGPIGTHTIPQILEESKKRCMESWNKSSGKSFMSRLFGKKSKPSNSGNEEKTYKDGPTRRYEMDSNSTASKNENQPRLRKHSVNRSKFKNFRFKKND